MGAIPWAWVVASMPRRISLILASIWLHCLPRFSPRFSPRSHHDRVAIGRRSWCYWFVDCRPFDRQRFRGEISSIVARSRFDRAAIVKFFHELPTPSDLNPSLQRSSRRGADCDHMAVRSESDDSTIFTKKGRSRSHGR